MPAPLPYELPPGVLVTVDVAPGIRTLIAEGLAKRRAEGRVTNDERVLRFVDALGEFVTRHRSADTFRIEDETLPDRWITTADAAAIIGVSQRQVRNYRDVESKLEGGRRLWLESDVNAIADRRMLAAEACGSLR